MMTKLGVALMLALVAAARPPPRLRGRTARPVHPAALPVVGPVQLRPAGPTVRRRSGDRRSFVPALPPGAVLSPDGRRVAWDSWDLAYRASFLRLHVANVDGTGEQVVANANPASGPAWSPDGSKIAFFGVAAT